jgi:hypothetical protein
MKKVIVISLVCALLVALVSCSCENNRADKDIEQDSSSDESLIEDQPYTEEKADFTGIASIVDIDGYSYDIEYNIYNPSFLDIDTTRGKPGESVMRYELPTGTATIINTTSGKQAPALDISWTPLYWENATPEEDEIFTSIGNGASLYFDIGKYNGSLYYAPPDMSVGEKRNVQLYNLYDLYAMRGETGDSFREVTVPENMASDYAEKIAHPDGWILVAWSHAGFYQGEFNHTIPIGHYSHVIYVTLSEES